MSWSYSPELVEEYLGANFSDTGLSALLNTTHTPDQYYWPDKQTEHSRISRFGMTCEPLTGIRGEELLTWYLAASHAKTSASPEVGPDWTAKGQGYGEKWLGLLGRYDPDSHSLKTVQLSLIEDLTGCCPTLPRWGLMLGGELYPQPIPALCTGENESGYWPTPNTEGFRSDGELALLAKQASTHKEYLLMSDRACKSKRERFWPTPTTQDNVQIRGVGAAANAPSRGTTLSGAVMMWPTPQASDNRDRGNASTPAIARRIEKGKQVMLSMWFSSENGRLNPEWVEWLMGWPLGHTGLKPLETGKYQEFVRQHGNYYTDKEIAA